MKYLLDTNACICLINGSPLSVRTRFRKAIAARAGIFVPTIAAFELCYGVGKSMRPEANTARVEAFLAGPVRLLPLEPEDAKAAGLVRASIEKTGRPIGACDLLIAGQALGLGMTLVSSNVREFRCLEGLA